MRELALTDTHAHCLPGLDDGPTHMAATLAALEMAAQAGVRRLVATPHWYPGLYKATTQEVQLAYEAVLEALGDKPHPELIVAREYLLCDELLELADKEPLATIGAGYVLIELGMRIPASLKTVVFGLRSRGYNLILAHPERCPQLVEEDDDRNWLLAQGCLFQLTQPSLMGDFGREFGDAAARLLKLGAAHLLASDAHCQLRGEWSLLTARRYLADHWGEELAFHLTEDWPQQLVEGKALDTLALGEQVRSLTRSRRRNLFTRLFAGLWR